jgi:hypothetical protein
MCETLQVLPGGSNPKIDQDRTAQGLVRETQVRERRRRWDSSNTTSRQKN